MNDPFKLTPQVVQESTDYLRQRWNARPEWGIILGTGSGDIADAIDVELELPYQQVPHLPASTAIGHRGQWVGGQLGAAKVIAMQGRFHLYEGYAIDQATLPVRMMHALGVKKLIVTNAAGGTQPDWSVGDVMMIHSHLDLMARVPRSPMEWPEPDQHRRQMALGRPTMRSDVYDTTMIENAKRFARSAGFPLRVGVYAAMLGPNYETGAEYRFLRKIGVQAVGMSTVPEVVVAADCGMQVMAISIITNVANPDQLSETTGHGVVNAGAVAAPKVLGIAKDAIAQSSNHP